MCKPSCGNVYVALLRALGELVFCDRLKAFVTDHAAQSMAKGEVQAKGDAGAHRGHGGRGGVGGGGRGGGGGGGGGAGGGGGTFTAKRTPPSPEKSDDDGETAAEESSSAAKRVRKRE